MSMPSSTSVHLEAHGDVKTYTFDRALWSHRVQDHNFASQETVMEEVGLSMVANAMNGYNHTLFAYGQTSSGKTYTVMGGESEKDEGLLPRVLRKIFETIDDTTQKESSTFQCTASYLEIYNEKIHDLLLPRRHGETPPNLEVRHHPVLGSYVPGLTEQVTENIRDCESSLKFGMQYRSVSATAMNDRSSRSHCIFTFNMTHTKHGEDGAVSTLRSKVNFVDLAGSERQKKTEASGQRLKEAGSINQSLSHLAVLIHKLAEIGERGQRQGDFVNFRNSQLTRLLQESLMGNSKTVMLVAISPALSNADETIGALRFAQSVKKIKTRPEKNKSSNAEMVASLKGELERLRSLLESSQGEKGDLEKQLRSREELAGSLAESFDDKRAISKESEDKRKELALSWGLATDAPEHNPFVINVSMENSLSGMLRFYFLEGQASTFGSDPSCMCALEGQGIEPFMCQIVNKNHTSLMITPLDCEGNLAGLGCTAECGRVMVNGRALKAPRKLGNGDRLIMGLSCAFLVALPATAKHDEACRRSSVSATSRFEEILAEVVPEDEPEFPHILKYLETMGKLLGEVRAKMWLDSYANLQPFVQEANAITQAVRRQDRYRLSIELINDVMHYTEDDPELVVRVWKGCTGMRRWRRIVQRNLLDEFDTPDESVVAVWEPACFHQRLAHMREIFDSFQTGGLTAVDFSKREDDPWRDIFPWELAGLLGDGDEAFPQQQQSSERLEDLKMQHEEERAQWREVEREKDARIARLEQQVALLTQSVRETPVHPHSQSLAVQLHEMSETSALLAAKITKGMEEMQRRLTEDVAALDDDDPW